MPALNAYTAWAKYTTACSIATQFPGQIGCMDELTTKRSFDSQTTLVIAMQNYFEMFFMDVYTTCHRRTSGRLVDELNVCTVHSGVKW